MIRTVEAVVDPNGNVRLLEDIQLPGPRRALLTILDDAPRSEETALLSEGALRPEYDLARLKGGVRGKYHQQATAGTNLVLLEPDVARAFPDSSSVNRALRLLREVATKSSSRSRKSAGGRRKATG